MLKQILYSCIKKALWEGGAWQCQPLLPLPLVWTRPPSTSPALTPASLGQAGDRVTLLPANCKVLQLCSELPDKLFQVVAWFFPLLSPLLTLQLPTAYLSSPYFLLKMLEFNFPQTRSGCDFRILY